MSAEPSPSGDQPARRRRRRRRRRGGTPGATDAGTEERSVALGASAAPGAAPSTASRPRDERVPRATEARRAPQVPSAPRAPIATRWVWLAIGFWVGFFVVTLPEGVARVAALLVALGTAVLLAATYRRWVRVQLDEARARRAGSSRR